MSWWSYIDGIIRVEPYGRTQAEKRYVLETVLNHLPLVTGSERDMEVHIIQEDGYNESSSCDEYGDCTNNLVGRYGYKDRDGWLEIQRTYILAVKGSLRDRHFNETYKEFIKWLCRLSKRINIDSVLVRIKDYEKETIIKDEEPFSNMYEWPSWCTGSNGEPAWWEHLTWDRMKDCEYPMLLGYKYFNDPENDTEVERRMKYYD